MRRWGGVGEGSQTEQRARQGWWLRGDALELQPLWIFDNSVVRR
jgi:hypothetical protein